MNIKPIKSPVSKTGEDTGKKKWVEIKKKDLGNPDKATEMLKKQMAQNQETLSSFLDTSGISIPVLKKAMATFIRSLLDLPKEAMCRSGCAYCCHLRVGVSIPEILVIHDELISHTPPEGFALLKDRIMRIANNNDIVKERFWLTTRTPCPFLDTSGQMGCLIYALRPFSCRAYHSTDRDACRMSYEKGEVMQIPCFPLFRNVTDMYSTVFINVSAQKGLFSYQVGFIRALGILLENDQAAEHWIQGQDVFRDAKLT